MVSGTCGIAWIRGLHTRAPTAVKCSPQGDLGRRHLDAEHGARVLIRAWGVIGNIREVLFPELRVQGVPDSRADVLNSGFWV